MFRNNPGQDPLQLNVTSNPNQCRSAVAGLARPCNHCQHPPPPLRCMSVHQTRSFVASLPVVVLCNYYGLLSPYGDEKCDQRKWSWTCGGGHRGWHRILSSPCCCRLNISHMHGPGRLLTLSSPSLVLLISFIYMSCTVFSMDTDSNQPPTTVRGIVGGREKWNGLP